MYQIVNNSVVFVGIAQFLQQFRILSSHQQCLRSNHLSFLKKNLVSFVDFTETYFSSLGTPLRFGSTFHSISWWMGILIVSCLFIENWLRFTECFPLESLCLSTDLIYIYIKHIFSGYPITHTKWCDWHLTT